MSATNRGTERLARDEYQTPHWVFEALIPYIQWDNVSSILEPCRGDGNIWNQLPKHPKKYWCEITEGRDYLKYRTRMDVDLIVTNPPYSLAMEFLKKSLAEAKTVAYLLRLNFLGSVARSAFLNDNRPDYQFTLAPRPAFFGGGTDATEYAWLIWDRGGFVPAGTPRFMSVGTRLNEDGVYTRTDGASLRQPEKSPGLILPRSLTESRRRTRKKAA